MEKKDHKEENFILVNLEGVRMEQPSQKPIILLKEQDGDRFLPIWIGNFEASAIALEMVDFKSPRPMTHDLIINIFKAFNIKIKRVVISSLIKETFFAFLDLQRNNDENIILDLRPSDAIAIALRVKSPIYVSEKVLEKAGLKITSIEEEVKKFRDFLDNALPEDFNI
ncbi:MAG: bifunctional nuclease family protein [Actinomycetota bacterium]|nr:bifunctional nuclease family protein [Actinomycetota bacterium]